MNFSANGSKKCLVSWKSTKNHRFGQTLQLFEQTTMFWHFDELFRKKMQKVARFVKKHEHSSIWPKLATSRRNYHVLAFRWLLQEKVAKRWKRWLISWKMTKNHRFGENFQLFEQTTMSWHFHELFSKKLQKAPHSVEKHEKSSIWPKLCNFFEQTTMSLHFNQLFGKRLQKVPHFVKQHEKSLIWPKLATFRTNYHVLAFRWTFQEKNAKSGPFREKARTLIDLAKTCNFSKKLPCLCISINFSGKSCKKCLISWNSTKNHWFGQSFATFGTSYNVFFLLMNFQEKSCKKCVVSWKSTKNHRFSQIATFRENYHVLTFRWTLQQKVAKSCSCREKARKIINLAKSLQLFEQTSMFLHFDEFSRKKLPKVLRFVKKHEKSSIWPKLCNFSSKLPCFGISMKFSAKSYEKCLISWKSTKNRRFGENSQLFQQTTMFWRFGELFSEKLQKVPRFLRKL